MAFEAAERLRTAADLDEVPRAVAWKEDEALEKHVPNAVESDEKVQQDASSRKRRLQELTSGASEEEQKEMDEYRRKRTMASDPMAAYLGKKEVV